MKVLILIFVTLFIIQQYQYIKIKNKIILNEEFSKIYLKSIKVYTVYMQFLKEKKLQKYPATKKILSRMFSNIQVFLESSSFQEITCHKVPKNEQLKYNNVLEAFSKEKENLTEEIESLFEDIMELQRMMLKSTNKFMYFMYQYDMKIKKPILLKIISTLIFILERILIFLQRRNSRKINSLEYIKVVKDYKNFRNCII